MHVPCRPSQLRPAPAVSPRAQQVRMASATEWESSKRSYCHVLWDGTVLQEFIPILLWKTLSLSGVAEFTGSRWEAQGIPTWWTHPSPPALHVHLQTSDRSSTRHQVSHLVPAPRPCEVIGSTALAGSPAARRTCFTKELVRRKFTAPSHLPSPSW